MAKRRTRPATPPLEFYKKLVLNQYLLRQFGVESFQEMSRQMKSPKYETVDSEGVSGFYKRLVSEYHDTLRISEDRIAQYDLNIVGHTRKINEKRDEKITLKYFQYLSLLFVEYYLDEYFNNRNGLLASLNAYVDNFNNGQEPVNKIELYKESDLNKIALWNATGSGKTLLMHINYNQLRHYIRGHLRSEDSSFILLTPKEGLSLQHIDDFKSSGIPASIYQKSTSKMFVNTDEIAILENTKLGDKDGDKTVAAARFGNKNVVFVDEGHRGASGDTWYKYRNMLCENGFSFEYSATFGQAVKASRNKDLDQDYAKCILFDYSYKYFYSDGYGKDYNIINLQNDSDEYKRQLYLVACLLTYYQQKKLYLTSKKQFALFNVENPLLVFVGGSVNAVRTENRRQVSDVVDILLFFSEVATWRATIIPMIEHLQTGHTGLLNDRNADIFRNAFTFLSSLNMPANAVYNDLLSTVFNCESVGATLHIENLKGVPGEIRLRLGENDPFGVINVGDDSALLKLCSENGLHTASVDFTESLFQNITRSDSSINLLIGSKKFTEGWNCWRVSTMGLMNVGRSEGSEIIQLFGRGVRLKGYGMSLKRSSFYVKDNPVVKAPQYISILETLNIFGVRADYMNQFREYLKDEGVPADKAPPYLIKLPVIRNKKYIKSKILTLKVRGDLNFKKHGPKPTFAQKKNSGVIILDCYAKVQFESSRNKAALAEVTKQTGCFKEIHLAGLDYEQIYFELQRYKNEKYWHNLNIAKKDIKPLLADNSWYKMLISREELELRDYGDFSRWTKIAVALLKKYCGRYYYVQKSAWEKPLLTYELMDDENENFIKDDQYLIGISNVEAHKEARLFIENLAKEMEAAKKSRTLVDFAKSKDDLTAVAFPASLYNPVMYLAKNSIDIAISPVPLNESEISFIQELRLYAQHEKTFFDNKELYIIRNVSKKGIGFFEEAGFYPDFIMWLVTADKQYITFIEPHGARDMSIEDEKVMLHTKIKDIEQALGNTDIVLNSIILSPTKHLEMSNRHIPKGEWNARNVVFMEDADFIKQLFNKIH
ncbi:DEAD/DEAH box helicase family protein [Pelotomaculum propionicicum]|uniref:DEAD/DEAH box helicase family protein n=1 Tax=Pelotomaculum propionicicum TaxID=258475 RepID=UPI003B7A5758